MELNVDIIAEGLKISCEDEFMEEMIEMLKEKGEAYVFAEGLESYSCNGSYTYFNAGEGNPFVGLSDAPCIAESVDYDDNGHATVQGEFWYYPDYMLKCPVEEMIENGYVIFRKT